MRLNVEESVFSDPRLNRFSRMVCECNTTVADVSLFVAIGSLCFLWHESQKQALTHVSPEQVDLWLFDGAAQILSKLGYLKPEAEGLRISGNQEQLESMEIWKVQRRAAGKRSAERRAEKKAMCCNHSETSTSFNELSTKCNEPSTNLQRDSTKVQRNSTKVKTITNTITNTNIIHNTNTNMSDCLNSAELVASVASVVDGAIASLEVAQSEAETKSENNAPALNEQGEGCVDVTLALENVRKGRFPRKDTGVSPETVVAIWNQHCNQCQPRVQTLNATRLRKIKARLKVYPEAEHWERATKETANWGFGLGKNDSGWIASLDWLISEKGLRAFEGGLGGKPVRKGYNGGTDYRDQSYRGDDNAILRAFEEGDNCEPF